MPRNPKPAAQAKAPTLPTVSPPEFHQEQQLVAARDNELRTIDLRYALDNEAYDYARTISYGRAGVTIEAQGILVTGRACLLLKEHESPERFAAGIAAMGISERTARDRMAATLRFGSEARKLATANLSASKLIELAHEPDEDIQALLDGGTLANKTLDQFERMSVRELRAAIREARADAETHSQQLLAKDEKINELDAALHKRPKRDSEHLRAEQLLASYDEAASEVFRSLTAMENTTAELYDVRKRAGHVFTVAITEKLMGTTSLLAKRLSKLQHFDGAK